MITSQENSLYPNPYVRVYDRPRDRPSVKELVGMWVSSSLHYGEAGPLLGQAISAMALIGDTHSKVRCGVGQA